MNHVLETKMTRKEFIKKVLVGGAAFWLFRKVDFAEAAGSMSVSDNLRPSVSIGSVPPSGTKSLWVDTGQGGVLKYYDGVSWVPTKATWG